MKLSGLTLKLFFISVLPLCFLSFSYAQTSVTNFEELQNAVSSYAEDPIIFDADRIDFTGNLDSLDGRTIFFTSNRPSTVLDGNFLYGGFRGHDTAALMFENIVFSNMKTPSLFNTSPSNYGGALYLSGSYAEISGNSSFNNNQAVSGGAIYAEGLYYDGEGLLLNDTVYFTGNKAALYGGAIALNNMYVYVNGAYFQSNQAAVGGALYSKNTYITAYSTVNFYNNSAALNGGAFAGEDNSTFEFYEQVYIQNNSAEEKGGGFYLNSSDAEFFDTANITNNSALLGGGFAAENNSIVSFDSSAAIDNNSASSNGGGFYSNNAAVVFWDTLQMNNNTSSGKGGGLYAVNNSLILGFGESTLSANTAYGDGGGFYAGSASGVSLGESEISYNRSYGSGGGFASDMSEVYFDYTADFTANTASVNGGGFSVAGGSEVTFEQITDFTNNSSGQNGGGFYSNASNISFWNNVNFDGNTSNAQGGGFTAANNSSVNFGSGAVFSKNHSGGSGGAVSLLSGSSATFHGDWSGASDVFEGNASSLNGGAISIENAFLYSYAPDIIFQNNTAQQNGGAVYFSGNNAIAHFGSDVKSISFNANSALNGGAVYIADSLQNFILERDNNIFESNTASNSGGAFFTDNGSVYISGNKSFTNNSAANYGGAAAITNGSSFNFGNDALFSDNSAGTAGGALFIDSSEVYLADPYFYGNTASAGGGAVYLQGSQNNFASLNIVTFLSTVFSGNIANGASNALHIGDYSSVEFTVHDGAAVEMHDGITSGNFEVSFAYSGAGDFNFYGDASDNYSEMTINSQNGAAFNLRSGAKLNAGNFYNMKDSIFNMHNSQIDTVNVNDFTNDGILNMEVFSSLNAGDSIIASGNVNLGDTSVLNLNDDFTDTNFRSKTFRLINFGGDLSGIFAVVNFNSPVIFSTVPVINYGDFIPEWITVTYRGDLNATNFRYLSGLSFNQKQTAKTFDALSENSAGDLDGVISVIEAGSDKEIKNALAQSSGYFLANVIRSAAIDLENKELYYRIKNHCSHGEGSGLWAQFNYNAIKNSSDENSLNDYKDTVAGMTAGYDMYKDGKMAGFYGKYNSHNISQDPKNEADMANVGVGVYGGIIEPKWELKGNISGSYNDFSTSRYIPFLNRKAEAGFNGTTFGADMEGTFKYKLSYDFELRPFAGLEFKKTYYNDFSESGAGSLNLDVEGGEYTRSAARIGIGTFYEKKFVSLYISGEVKYLLSEEFPQIESSFENTKVIFKSRGAQEGRAELGASAGVSVRIIDSVKIFTNTSFLAAEKYSNFYANLGARYNFCKLRKKSKSDTTADGFNYAPPPGFTNDSSLSAPSHETKTDENKLSDDFFDSLIDGINKNNLTEDMQTALTDKSKDADSAISIELIKPVIDENDISKSSANKPKTYILNMSNFVVNKAVLTEKAANDLIFIANEIMNSSYKSIKISGHTDSTGNDEINAKLSKERAKSVYDTFVKAGIPPEKMYYLGMSSLKPAASNNTKEGRAKNRRVEIEIE
ncbi:MAG: autotransporter domain-containing protein [Endomicrobia bacterium]|nr:autotransporter domain-containing protein [Endomicrobiia bacterium]